MFGQYLKTKKIEILLFVLMMLVSGATFYLFQVDFVVWFYPVSICLFLGLIALVYGFSKTVARHGELEKIKNYRIEYLDGFPKASTILEEDYQQLLLMLRDRAEKNGAAQEQKYQDMMDYYSTWVHQIKTPIAAMKLNLQNEDSELARMQQNELARIEQYVEMVLTFLRLDSDSTDYVFREYDLDTMIKASVRKFRGAFIAGKLTLNYEPVCASIVTDEKWLSFVIEQVLSNALKYTRTGSITISYQDGILSIRDTGMGIAPEDLPRIFEKGYTGFQGRKDHKATGIGLYLCKRICNNLNHDIYAESRVGEGTDIKIKLQ